MSDSDLENAFSELSEEEQDKCRPLFEAVGIDWVSLKNKANGNEKKRANVEHQKIKGNEDKQ